MLYEWLAGYSDQFQAFNPTSNGIDFVTVQSAKTLDPGIFNLGIFLNYARNPLPEFNNNDRTPFESRNSITAMDLGIGIGIFPALDLGINLPITVSNSVKISFGAQSCQYHLKTLFVIFESR